MRIAVLGGSISGLLASLVLSRDGHDITVIERDPLEPGPAAASFDWPRKGVGHFHQPHAFLPRGRSLLRTLLPDVFDDLFQNGACDAPLLRGLADPRPGDDEIAYLALRRPLIEWALRRALRRSPCTVQPGSVTSLITRADGSLCVCGVALHDGTGLHADLVIDAMGRNSPVPQWLAAAGIPVRTESHPVGCVYYSRYFRLKDGASICTDALPIGPRGDVGYAAYATFPGENGTFGVALIAPSWDAELRCLQRRAAFEAACAAIGPVGDLMRSVMHEPITPVLPMGSLRNTFRHFEDAPVPGLVALGDSYCHTDPMFALGLSNALIHTDALAAAVREHPVASEQMAAAYYSAIHDEAAERFRFACDVAAARERSWRGERVDFTTASGCYPLFVFGAAALASRMDQSLRRTYWRRVGLLDRTAVFDTDTALHARIEQILAAALASGMPSPAPPRPELLRMLREAPVA